MNKNIVIVGLNSFIGRQLYLKLIEESLSVKIISHVNIDEIDFTDLDYVINCALHPDYKCYNYNVDKDIDLKIAQKAADNNVNYIMFSTRRVYGSTDELKRFNENTVCNPVDFYGQNKLISESSILKLSDKNIILRGSNIFGFEYKRKSFMGFFMNQLKDNGSINIDVSPYTIRDIIRIDDVTRLVYLIIKSQIYGVYNLSTSTGEKVGNVANYLIKGFGSGDLVSTSKQLKDQFILDNVKLLSALNIHSSYIKTDYESTIEEMGRILCKI